MAHDLSRSDQDFLERLLRLGQCRIERICADLGVTATAVRQRLSRMRSLGMVERQTVSSGRGRPHHEYRVTAAGQQSLGDDYPALARILWQELMELEDDDLRGRLLMRLQKSLVKRYRAEAVADSLADRFHQLGSALTRQGFTVEIEQRESGEQILPVLKEHACPYQELAAEDSTICELEQAVFTEVVGVPVALTQCCRDGHDCCEFAPVGNVNSFILRPDKTGNDP